MISTAANASAPRRARKPLLVVHIVASVGLLGAVSSGVLIAIAAATGKVDGDAYELLSLQSAVFGIPLSFASLLSVLKPGGGSAVPPEEVRRPPAAGLQVPAAV